VIVVMLLLVGAVSLAALIGSRSAGRGAAPVVSEGGAQLEDAIHNRLYGAPSSTVRRLPGTVDAADGEAAA
jgi:hypothetical protein